MGEAGRVLQLLHPADLGHGLGLLLLLLLVLRAGHLYLMLLVCRGKQQHTLGLKEGVLCDPIMESQNQQ